MRLHRSVSITLVRIMKDELFHTTKLCCDGTKTGDVSE